MSLSSALKKLLNIDLTVVESARIDADGSPVIGVRPRKSQLCRCFECGQRRPVYDMPPTGPRRWRSLNFGTAKVFLEHALPRVSCPEHGVHPAGVPWAHHASRFARDFEEQVAWLCAHANRSVVAALMRIDWKSVGGICKRACDRLEAEAGSRFGNLLRIGIDETSCKKGRKHMVVVPDHAAGRAVWCGKERGKKTSRSFFDLLACSLVALVLPTGEGLDKWLARACRSHNSKVKELSKKIRRHKDAIACSVELGISNARVEAVNDKIKLTVRMGYGFRNFDNLIALVMLRCSNLPITLPGRTQAA